MPFINVKTSKELTSEKIETVNVAVREMLTAFKKIENPKVLKPYPSLACLHSASVRSIQTPKGHEA